MNKLYKRALCLVLALVVMAGTIVVYPKRAQADIMVTIATKLAEKGLTILNSTVVWGLDYAAERTGHNEFTQIGNLVAKLPFGSDTRNLSNMCKEIIKKVDELSDDVARMNTEVSQYLAQISSSISENELSARRGNISEVAARASSVVNGYRSYLAAADDYLTVFNECGENPTKNQLDKLDAKKKEMDKALSLFVSAGNAINFSESIRTIAKNSCILYPEYKSSSPTYTNVKTDIDYANELARLRKPFEHQIYEFVTNETNITASAFSTVAMANRIWAEYKESVGTLTTNDEATLEKTLDEAAQGINDVAGQAYNYVGKYMRGYDVEKSVEMVYTESKLYRDGYLKRSDANWKENESGKSYDLTLKAWGTAPKLDFYNVKPVGGKVDYYVLKNAVSGPKDTSHLTATGQVTLGYTLDGGKTFYYVCEGYPHDFTTMDLDFFNLMMIKGKNYWMPRSTNEFKDIFVKSVFDLSGRNVISYLADYGGLEKINKSATVMPLSDWKDYDSSFFHSTYNTCKYNVVELGNYNIDKPSKSEKTRHDKGIVTEKMIATLWGYADKNSSLLKIEVAGQDKITVSPAPNAMGGSGYIPGTELEVTFSSPSTVLSRRTVFSADGVAVKNSSGLAITNMDGELLHTLVEPDSYSLLETDGVIRLKFPALYQSFKLVAYPKGSSKYDVSQGTNSIMSVDSLSDASGDSGSYSLVEAFMLGGGDYTETDETPDTTAEQPEAYNQGGIKLKKIDNPPVFTDIGSSSAKEDIEFLANYGIANGMGDGLYMPDTVMSRGMFIAALSRFSGEDINEYMSSSFSDVSSKSWLRPYIDWAYKNGIVLGHSGWLFEPDEPITREQAAVILEAFLETAGVKPANRDEQPAIADENDISDWAADEVYSIVGYGIMNVTDGRFNPKGTMTRAEVAKAFAAMLRTIGN